MQSIMHAVTDAPRLPARVLRQLKQQAIFQRNRAGQHADPDNHEEGTAAHAHASRAAAKRARKAAKRARDAFASDVCARASREVLNGTVISVRINP